MLFLPKIRDSSQRPSERSLFEGLLVYLGGQELFSDVEAPRLSIG